MKKILALALAVLMLASLCACGKKEDTKSSESAASSSSVESSNSDSAAEATTSPAEVVAAKASLNGKLNYIKLDDRDSSILRGVSTYGNRAGTTELNSKEPATEGIRCIFELNEYVGFTLDTDKTTGFSVWVLKHTDDQKTYETAEFSDQMAGFAQYCELKKDTENPENNSWGEFYLNPDNCEPGYYDFVFVYDGKALATLVTKFYKESELSGKADAQLEKLMTEE